MNTDQTISAFIEFFRDRGHQPVESNSLLSRPGDPGFDAEHGQVRQRLVTASAFGKSTGTARP